MEISIPGFNGKPYTIKFKKLIFPLLILIIVLVVLAKISELKEIGRLFSQIEWYWVPIIACAQIINISFQAGTYRTIFKILKFPAINFFKLMKITLVMIFFDFTIPSYGFAGNIYFLKLLKKKGYKEGRVLMMIIIQLVTFYFALLILVVTALIYLFIRTKEFGFLQIILASGFFAMFAFVIFLIYFWLGNRKRSLKRVMWFCKKFYKTDGENQEERVKTFLNDFYVDLQWIKENKTKLIGPTIVQFGKFLSDGLTIFLIFLAFGHYIYYGISLMTFAFGRIFGLVSLIPGGVGAIESAMTLTSSILGVGLELSIAAMLIYRFFSYWLYFPFGLMFYKQFSRKEERI